MSDKTIKIVLDEPVERRLVEELLENIGADEVVSFRPMVAYGGPCSAITVQRTRYVANGLVQHDQTVEVTRRDRIGDHLARALRQTAAEVRRVDPRVMPDAVDNVQGRRQRAVRKLEELEVRWRCPIVQLCLQYHRRGMPLTDAMVQMVQLLVERNEGLMQAATERYWREPVTFLYPPKMPATEEETKAVAKELAESLKSGSLMSLPAPEWELMHDPYRIGDLANEVAAEPECKVGTLTTHVAAQVIRRLKADVARALRYGAGEKEIEAARQEERQAFLELLECEIDGHNAAERFDAGCALRQVQDQVRLWGKDTLPPYEDGTEAAKVVQDFKAKILGELNPGPGQVSQAGIVTDETVTYSARDGVRGRFEHQVAYGYSRIPILVDGEHLFYCGGKEILRRTLKQGDTVTLTMTLDGQREFSIESKDGRLIVPSSRFVRRNQFQPGDQVRHRHGNQVMTVDKVDAAFVECSWITSDASKAGDVRLHGSFLADALVFAGQVSQAMESKTDPITAAIEEATDEVARHAGGQVFDEAVSMGLRDWRKVRDRLLATPAEEKPVEQPKQEGTGWRSRPGLL